MRWRAASGRLSEGQSSLTLLPSISAGVKCIASMAQAWSFSVSAAPTSIPDGNLLSRPEAIFMDPQQRLLLEHTMEVTRSAGKPFTAQTSVMVGIGTVDYVGLSGLLPLSMYFATGGANSVAAGRISYLFGLKGPCISIDTACSSSLVGAHYAVRDLRAGACDAALASGVNLTLSPQKSAAFTITGDIAGCPCWF